MGSKIHAEHEQEKYLYRIQTTIGENKMSTVDKKTADRIVAGEFPEDNIVCIIRYENMFNGAEAYKIIPAHKSEMIQWILDGKELALINPSIYWKKEEMQS